MAMSVSGSVVAIVAIIAFAVIKLARIRNGTDMRGRIDRQMGRHMLLDPAEPSPRELELQREVEALRDRVHVLERIATDGRHTRNLADEIERLRDN